MNFSNNEIHLRAKVCVLKTDLMVLNRHIIVAKHLISTAPPNAPTVMLQRLEQILNELNTSVKEVLDMLVLTYNMLEELEENSV